MLMLFHRFVILWPASLSGRMFCQFDYVPDLLSVLLIVLLIALCLWRGCSVFYSSFHMWL